MTDYIEFVLYKQKPKTAVYLVVNTKSDPPLPIGYIEWYPQWRQYCFFPNNTTFYNKECLQDITDFIQDLMEKRKK